MTNRLYKRESMLNEMHTELVQIKALLQKLSLIMTFPKNIERDYLKKNESDSIKFFNNNGYYILIIYLVTAFGQRLWLDLP